MTNDICKNCKGPKAKYECGICHECTCKKCTQFIEEDFIYLDKIPENLSHPQYCPACFDEFVANDLHDYQHTVEEAKEVIVFLKDQSKVTRLMNRKAEPLKVNDCVDQETALIKMSYQAVKMGYNAIIDVEFKNKKVINGSHKKIIVDAVSIPTNIDKNKKFYE